VLRQRRARVSAADLLPNQADVDVLFVPGLPGPREGDPVTFRRERRVAAVPPEVKIGTGGPGVRRAREPAIDRAQSEAATGE